MDVDRDEIAGGTLADEVVTRIDRIEPARDLGQAERDARGVAGVDHLPALLDVEGHRLLEQDVLAGGGRGQDVGQVRGVRRGDHHGVDVGASEERLDRGFGFRPELGGEGRGAGPAGDGHQAGSTGGLFRDGHGMDMGHPARADHPEPDGHSGAPSPAALWLAAGLRPAPASPSRATARCAAPPIVISPSSLATVTIWNPWSR